MSVPEVQERTWWWVMGNQVFVMNDTILVWHLSVRKSGIIFLTYSWLTEINHRDWVSWIDEFHSGKLGKSTSKTVTSGLYSIAWVKALKSFDFLQNVRVNWSCCCVKSRVNLAVSACCSKSSVFHLVYSKICNPVSDRLWSSENNVDWTIWRKVADEAFNIVN